MADTSVSRECITTTSAASMATSVPAPMAMPTVARFNAGASLMPSPTMATVPRSSRRRITASLPSGSTPAMTSSTPASRPMALAVRALSPVSITTRMPMFCSSFTAWAESGLMASATAIRPKTVSFSPKYRGVLPCSANVCPCASRAGERANLPPMNFPEPPQRVLPFRRAVSPLPESTAKSVTGERATAFSAA